MEFRCSYTRKRTAVPLITGREYSVGADEGNGIVLEGQDVLGQHATMVLDAGGPRIAPIKEAPVSVNGQPVTTSAHRSDGDWLTLGSTLFQVHLAENELSQTTAQGFVQPAEPMHRKKPAGTGVITIGRSPECDHAIDSPLVSRQHARLTCEATGVVIEDLHSTNGTFVNGQQLVERVKLRQGDRVAIATFAFIFTGDSLEPVDTAGRVRVEVRDLCKEGASHDRRLSPSRAHQATAVMRRMVAEHMSLCPKALYRVGGRSF